MEFVKKKQVELAKEIEKEIATIRNAASSDWPTFRVIGE